jgi:hypothetical protein
MRGRLHRKPQHARSNPAKPRDLGVIGRDHLYQRMLDGGCDLASLDYRKAEITHDGLPYVIEVAFGYRGDASGLRVVEGFNFSPAIGGSPFQLEHRLENADVEEDDPVTVFAHLTSPRLDFLDRGKARVSLPDAVEHELMGMVATVTKKWTKQKRAEIRDAQARWRREDVMARRDRPTTTKDAAYAVMLQAYMTASAQNTLPAAPRQIMYAARRSVLEATGKETLNDKYFTQTLLPDFMAENPELIADWDIAWDDRGHFREPHTGREIGLGTLAVRQYIKDLHGPRIAPARIANARVETLGPAGRYSAALFCEKEGFDQIVRAAGIPELFDIAPLSTKGMSVTAARMLVEELCGRRKLPLFVLHDFDISGFSILKTLTTSNRRYTFKHKVARVIDLGLRLADVRRLGLDSEPVAIEQDKDKLARRLRINGATPAEIAFLLRGQRVELNAMASDVFVQFIVDKLSERGVAKVTPSPDTLAETYAAYKRGAMAQQTLDAELARLNAVLVEVPADLAERVRAYLEENRGGTWDAAVRAVMEDER